MAFKGKPKEKTKEKPKKVKEPMDPRMARVFKGIVVVLVTAVVVVMLLARVTGTDALRMPENAIGQVITPVQGVFANVTDMFVSYMQKLKLRSNLELEYNKLLGEYNQLVQQAMLADQLQNQLAVYQDMVGEMSLNESMKPILATVIGQDEGNYSATLTINKGTRDGIEDYMAVTVDGALAGYTYGTTETKSQVKAIIDTDASIPALIESTRDQGAIRGTLGKDGTAMCHMFHVDAYIPRPGDKVVTSGFAMPFPKGIPIGTVRESTRGMEANKQYIVVEPFVDFDHIEYVIVYRYQPVPSTLQVISSNASQIELLPLDTPRPVPTLQVAASSLFGGDALPSETPPADASPTPSATPKATAELPPSQTAGPPGEDEIVFVDPNAGPTDTPMPTDAPTPTPEYQMTVDDLTLEADN